MIIEKKATTIWKICGGIILFVAIFILFFSVTTSEAVKTFIHLYPIWGSFVLIFLTVISQVFAPITGTPILLLGAAVYGIWKISFLMYISGVISSMINFWISRRFGRNLVRKFVGKKNLEQIDEFVEDSGIIMLILSRIFGFSIFELISYAFGLTTISFKKYIIITIVFSLIPTFVFAYAFKDANFASGTAMIIWFGTTFLCGSIFAFLIKKRLRKKK